MITILERVKNGELGAYDLNNDDLEDWVSDIIISSGVDAEPEYYNVINDVLDFLDTLHVSKLSENKPVTPEEFQEQIDLLRNAKPETELDTKKH